LTPLVHFENGKVLLPRSAPWLGDFIAEHLRFGSRGAAHDDLVDAMELAVRSLTTGSLYGISFEAGFDDPDGPLVTGNREHDEAARRIWGNGSDDDAGGDYFGDAPRLGGVGARVASILRGN
jgi:hypothetical protein